MLILDKNQLDKLKEAAKPLMEFLSNFHPHVQVTVTENTAEFFEGIALVRTDEFLKD